MPWSSAVKNLDTRPQRVVHHEGRHRHGGRCRAEQARAEIRVAGAGAAQGDGLARLVEEVEAEFADAHGTADQAAAGVVGVDAENAGQIVAEALGEGFFADDGIEPVTPPVEADVLGVVAQLLEKQGVAAEHDLLEQVAGLFDDGAGHVLADADIGDAGGGGLEGDAHRQAVDEQRAAAVDVEGEIEAEIDGEGGIRQLRPGGEAEREAAAAVAGTGQHRGEVAGRDVVGQQLAHREAAEGGGFVENRAAVAEVPGGADRRRVDSGFGEQLPVGGRATRGAAECAQQLRSPRAIRLAGELPARRQRIRRRASLAKKGFMMAGGIRRMSGCAWNSPGRRRRAGMIAGRRGNVCELVLR